jgi:hypothetical protein
MGLLVPIHTGIVNYLEHGWEQGYALYEPQIFAGNKY